MKIIEIIFFLSILTTVNAQFSEPLNSEIFPYSVHLNKSNDVIFSLSTAFDSFHILNETIFPLGTPRPILGRTVESYICIFNKERKLTKLLHFYGKQSIQVRGDYLDDTDNYYFALSGPDTILIDNKVYSNSLDLPNYLFCYSLRTNELKLCKLFGNAWENIKIFADDHCVYLALQFVGTAMVDTFRFQPLRNSVHEQDILVIRLSKVDYSVEMANSLRGESENIPIYITADEDQNIFLLADVYSKYLIYNMDSILLPMNKYGMGIALNISKHGIMQNHHTTNGSLSQAIVQSDGSFFVLGNYYNVLEIDDKIVLNSMNSQNGFVAHFDGNGEYKGIIAYNGIGNRAFSIMKHTKPNRLIISGQFDNKISESSNVDEFSKGYSDAYIFFGDTNGLVSKSLYFKGDSNEVIEKIALKDNGTILILGSTFSDTLECKGNYFSPLYKTHKNYFLYEIDTALINNSNEIFNTSNEVRIYPNPCMNEINIFVPTEKKIKHIFIYNYLGELIFRKHYASLQNNIKLLDFLPLNSEIYNLTIVYDDNTISNSKVLNISK